jgi:AcrR family transcriptional regulator
VTDTREKILKETWSLMEKTRGKGVRLEDIARAADVSRQAIYLHFGSRAGLLIETARYLDETLGLPDRTAAVWNAATAEEALDAMVSFWANYIPDIYGLAKALMTVRESDPDAASAWNDRMAAVYEKCLVVAQRLRDEGTLTGGWSAEEAADYMWSLLAISNWEHFTLERGWSQAQYIERFQQTFRRVLVGKSP